MTARDSAATGLHSDDGELRLIYAVGRFDTALRAELKRRLAPLDLTLAEFTTLSVLTARSGLSNAQLARRALVTPQAMNQVLGSLEEKGLTRRGSPLEDRSGAHHRARGAQLTAKGERQVRRCIPLVDAIEDACFAEIKPSERAALATMLGEATQRLRTSSVGAATT
jgi:DNA-binding MarR family transcriptional regulator